MLFLIPLQSFEAVEEGKINGVNIITISISKVTWETTDGQSFEIGAYKDYEALIDLLRANDVVFDQELPQPHLGGPVS